VAIGWSVSNNTIRAFLNKAQQGSSDSCYPAFTALDCQAVATSAEIKRCVGLIWQKSASEGVRGIAVSLFV